MAAREQQGVFIRVHALVGVHIHDVQVDRIERELREDTGEDGGDAELGVQKPRHETGQQSRRQRHEQRQPHRAAREREHHGDGAAGGERAVHRQIRDVEQAERDIDAQRHDAPDQALRHAARQTPDQIRNAQGGKIGS